MTDRNYAIDFIRFVAIIGVVLIHVSTAFTERVIINSFNFYLFHFLNQFARFAIPLFFGISGFLLAARYTKIHPIVDFYKRRISKIILPYTIWVLIYYLIVFPNSIKSLQSWDFLENFFKGNASYQLYFIPAIVVLYLIFPLLVAKRKIFLNKWFILFKCGRTSHLYCNWLNHQLH